MLDLRGLEDWFFNNTKRISTQSQGAYWTLRRDHGRTVYTNLEVEDPQESYRMLCNYIENQALNGAREFEVWFKLSKTDPTKTSFVIQVPYGYTGAKSADQAGTGIHGLPAAASPAIGQLMEQRMNERLEAQKREFDLQLQRLKEHHENEKRFQELEGSLAAMIETKKTFADKLIERLEEQPKVLEKLIDAIGPGIRGVVSQLFPQVGVAGAQYRSEVPAAPLDLTGSRSDILNMEHREQLAVQDNQHQPGIDFNPAIQAFLNLHQSGFPDAAGDILRLSGAAVELAQVEGFEDDPVGVIEAVVNFVTSNPGQAKMLLGQLQ